MSEELEVFRLLTRMENTSARLEKEELIEEFAKLELGKFAIQWAYDPFITFGIRPAKREIGSGAKPSVSLRPALIKTLLENLAKRNLTGNAAEREIYEVMNILTDDGAEILFRILSKDLKCGVGVSTLNKVVPGVVPTFCVMRAHPYEEKRIKTWPQIIEPKMDGFRYTFIARNGGAGFFTRSGKPAPAVDHLIAAMLKVAEKAFYEFPDLLWMRDADRNPLFVADGEMIAGKEFNDTSGALRRQSEAATDAQFHIFDMMPWEHFDAAGSVGHPLKVRRRFVSEFVECAFDLKLDNLITKTPAYSVDSHERIMFYYDKFRARKLEGAMVKNPDGLYDKKKSYGWMKVKPEETEDLQIVGAYPGEPHTKYEHCLGGLVMLRKGVIVRCGGGFSDDQRVEFWKQIWEDIALADKSAVKTEKGETIVSTSVIGISDRTKILFNLAEIEFHEVTPDGSLRHPRFIRLRGDKLGEVESK